MVRTQLQLDMILLRVYKLIMIWLFAADA